MSPHIFQGFFHLYIDIIVALIAVKLWISYKKSGNLIAKNLSIAMTLYILEYIALTFAIFFLFDNPLAVRYIGAFGWIFAYAGTIMMYWALTYIYPKLPRRVPVVVFALLGFISALAYLFPLRPALVNHVGIINFDHPAPVILIGSLFFMGTWIPMGVALIFKTIRQKQAIKGIVSGLGFAIAIIFLPLTYQTEDFQSFLFLTFLTGIGFTLALIGIFWPTISSEEAKTAY